MFRLSRFPTSFGEIAAVSRGRHSGDAIKPRFYKGAAERSSKRPASNQQLSEQDLRVFFNQAIAEHDEIISDGAWSATMRLFRASPQNRPAKARLSSTHR